MATIGETSRPEYIYDQATDTWIPVGIGPHSHTPAAIGAISSSVVTAKGDIVTGTGSGLVSVTAVGNNGETIVADSSTATGLRYQAPKTQNAIYNSSMDIAQRGTSFTTVSGVVYTLDRWSSWASAVGSSLVTTQETGTATSRYSAKLRRSTGNTNTGGLYYFQSLETSDSLRFQGQTVTLSFYAKAGANYSAASSILDSNIRTGTGTDQIYYNYTGTANSNQSNTLTTSWQRFTHTTTLSASATEVSIAFVHTPVGTAGADDSFFVTGVQLEVGSVATPYNRMSGTIQGELAACQRYYQRQATNGANNVAPVALGFGLSTTTATFVLKLTTTMRTAPTSLDASGMTVFTATSVLTPAGTLVISTNEAGLDNVGLFYTHGSAALATNAPYKLGFYGTNYIGVSAEL